MIRLTIGGAPLGGDFEDLNEELMEDAIERIREAVCPVHGKSIEVNREGDEIVYEPCCEAMNEAIDAALDDEDGLDSDGIHTG